jgi:hypothetical protein
VYVVPYILVVKSYTTGLRLACHTSLASRCQLAACQGYNNITVTFFSVVLAHVVLKI